MRIRLSEDQRATVFWGVCIPVRLFLATNPELPLLRPFAAVIGGRWVLGLENGDEGLFGGPVWWAQSRYVHGALWLLFAATGEARYLWADVAGGALHWMVQKA